jgi:hypothetical protein
VLAKCEGGRNPIRIRTGWNTNGGTYGGVNRADERPGSCLQSVKEAAIQFAFVPVGTPMVGHMVVSIVLTSEPRHACLDPPLGYQISTGG